jgi:hypothetical protein
MEYSVEIQKLPLSEVFCAQTAGSLEPSCRCLMNKAVVCKLFHVLHCNMLALIGQIMQVRTFLDENIKCQSDVRSEVALA